jgi:hypothetical protein
MVTVNRGDVVEDISESVLVVGTTEGISRSPVLWVLALARHQRTGSNHLSLGGCELDKPRPDGLNSWKSLFGLKWRM